MTKLYDDLLARGEQAINELVATAQQENVELEFKTKAPSKSGEMYPADRENLAEALSGFSNSAGGLLIWGIVAKKDKATNIDAACDWAPVSDIKKFKSDALRYVSQAIMPRHDGVRIEAIESTRAPGAGYLLVDIERSDRRPHRAEFGPKQYYKRVGDSFIAMEHYDIEDAFRRVSVAELSLGLRFAPAGRTRDATGGHNTVLVTLILSNNSSQTARYPYLSIPAGNLNTLEAMAGFSIHSHDGWAVFSALPDVVIHPGLEMPAARGRSTIPVVRAALAETISRQFIQPFDLLYKLGCFNSPMKTGSITIDLEQACKELFPTTAVV